MIATPLLSPAQEAEAQRIFQVLRQSAEQDLLALARLLSSRADRDLLGPTELEVRDRVQHLGAQAVQTALQERKKRGTRGRA